MRGFPRQAQGAANRIDNLRLQIDARVQTANLIVEKLADLRGVTKDAAHHGQRDWGVRDRGSRRGL